MVYEDIFEKVKEIICENFDVDGSKVTPETNLFEDLDADSLDLVDLISSVEYEFNVEAEDETIENIKTVNDVVECVHKLKN